MPVCACDADCGVEASPVEGPVRRGPCEGSMIGAMRGAGLRCCSG